MKEEYSFEETCRSTSKAVFPSQDRPLRIFLITDILRLCHNLRPLGGLHEIYVYKKKTFCGMSSLILVLSTEDISSTKETVLRKELIEISKFL